MPIAIVIRRIIGDGVKVSGLVLAIISVVNNFVQLNDGVTIICQTKGITSTPKIILRMAKNTGGNTILKFGSRI